MARVFRKSLAERMHKIRSQSRKDGSEIPVPWSCLFQLIPGSDHMADQELAAAVETLFASSVTANREVHQGVVEYLKNYTSGRNESDDMLSVLLFKQICQHPGKSDLIFYSSDFFEHPPSVEEIVSLSTEESPG